MKKSKSRTNAKRLNRRLKKNSTSMEDLPSNATSFFRDKADYSFCLRVLMTMISIRQSRILRTLRTRSVRFAKQ